MFLWIGLFLVIVVAGIIISIFISPPTVLADWILGKFELHPQIGDATITYEGEQLEGQDKLQIIDFFNNAIYVERYGFLPETTVTPVVLTVNKGKNIVSFFVYSYNDHVDVFKQCKKKVVAYQLLSQDLQQRSMTTVS